MARLSWGSRHPGYLIYLVDLSGSMSDDGKVENLIKVLKEVSMRLIDISSYNGQIANRFYMKIIKYNDEVETLFEGNTTDLDNRLVNKGSEPFFDPTNEARPGGWTCTASAFQEAIDSINKWIEQQKAKNQPIPAPIVIHITDGWPEDGGNPQDALDRAKEKAEELQRISVPDGNVRLFNIQICGVNENYEKITFPTTAPSDVHQRFLYDISTSATEEDVRNAALNSLELQVGSRLMVANENDAENLVKVILFGSNPPVPR